jgi:hypothetical protein
MTSRGTALFINDWEPWFLVTPEDLETGHITIVELNRNGQVKDSFRRRACNMWPVYLVYCSQRKPLNDVKEDRVGGYALINFEYVTSPPTRQILTYFY